MTSALYAPLRRTLSARGDERPASGSIAALRRAWANRRAFRRALAELRALSVRQREDIGVAGLDLAAVARAATYRS